MQMKIPLRLCSYLKPMIAAVAFVAFGHSAVAQKQPNILLILADDLGTLDLNCYGSRDLETPNLDRLAERGVRFTQFYSIAPVCSPSRTGLLTGKTNVAAGWAGNVPIPDRDPELSAGLPSSQTTIAEMLKKNDYYTAAIGKWHLGHADDKLPNGQGFDYFFGHQRGVIDNYSHFFYWNGPNKHDLYQNHDEIDRAGQYFPDLMVDEIKGVINRAGHQPFFIYWAANIPHYPYQGTAKWQAHYQDVASPRREYAAFVSTLDERVGWVLDELEKKGALDNTVIIFQSDNGHSFEDRALWGGGNTGPYRGGKFSLFEGGIRVPAIISYPPAIPAGIVCDDVASGMDWFPTIAALTGAQYEASGIEGISLLPVISNEQRDATPRILHWQPDALDDNVSAWAVRQGDWKLMANTFDPDPTFDSAVTGEDFKGKDRLFLVNLSSDIGERKNVLNEYPEKANELLILHQNWLQRVRPQINHSLGLK